MKFSFAGISLALTRDRKENPAVTGVYERYTEALLKQFPALKAYEPSSRTGPTTAKALLDFYHAILPLTHEPAREAALRSQLASLSKKTEGDFRIQIEREIAKSNLRSGVVDRTLGLLTLPSNASAEDAKLAAETKREMGEFEQHYGARFGYLSHLATWRKIPGDIRGASLAWFFAHQELKPHTKILHFAPESALRAFFNATKKEKGIEYITSDVFRDHEDLIEDITELHLQTGYFDLVICHRVLEHIFDDRAALKELFRVLAPGGALSISVPQSMNRAATNEWIVPDLSHDGHLRQYGRDFKDRLAEAGFQVQIASALLIKTIEEHVRDGTYPMRFYTCTKPL